MQNQRGGLPRGQRTNVTHLRLIQAQLCGADLAGHQLPPRVTAPTELPGRVSELLIQRPGHHHVVALHHRVQTGFSDHFVVGQFLRFKGFLLSRRPGRLHRFQARLHPALLPRGVRRENAGESLHVADQGRRSGSPRQELPPPVCGAGECGGGLHAAQLPGDRKSHRQVRLFTDGGVPGDAGNVRTVLQPAHAICPVRISAHGQCSPRCCTFLRRGSPGDGFLQLVPRTDFVGHEVVGSEAFAGAPACSLPAALEDRSAMGSGGGEHRDSHAGDGGHQSREPEAQHHADHAAQNEESEKEGASLGRCPAEEPAVS